MSNPWANPPQLCGNLGIPGGGVNPLRGQNNVQGACDMGGLPNVYTGYQPVTDEGARKKMEAAWGVTDLPEKPGLTVTKMVPMAHDGDIKAMYIIGENPLVSDPDLNHAEKSFGNLEFLVVQDIFMTETARIADVVLPTACFAEKEGTFSNTERRVQRVRKAVDAPGDAWDDWKITAAIANRMGYPMNYESAREIFEEIASVTPSYAGITYARINKEGLHWPSGARIIRARRFSIPSSLPGAVGCCSMPLIIFRQPSRRMTNIPCTLTTGWFCIITILAP
ncbi:MAG: molybdopterin-dependent oxidoreductase [Desulfobacterales bacterium]